jgi:hypothetical protein
VLIESPIIFLLEYVVWGTAWASMPVYCTN